MTIRDTFRKVASAPAGVLILILALGLFVSGPVYAQVVGATLSGTISDASGAVIPGAKVSITNTATGITRDVVATDAGFYTSSNLQPGPYQISASATGFSTRVQSGIVLTVGAQQALNFTMEVGQVTETVQVTTEPPAVQLESSTISGVVESNTIRELPLNGRDWTQLATLQPGVSSLGSLQLSVTGTSGVSSSRTTRGLGNQLSISGGKMQQNSYRVDGITMNDYDNGPPGDVIGVALGVDAIQEFSVITSNYSAEYGRTSGGVVNAITRSGTNQLHGDAYEFLRNSALDARNFFDPAKLPEFRRNLFGASAGAPIIKDKTFIFGDFEGLRQSLGLTRIANVPSPAARSGNLCSIPTGVTPNCTSSNVTVDPNIAKILPLWPVPNIGLLGNGDTGRYSFASSQISTDNFFVIRADHHFSSNDSIFATYQWDKSKSTLPDSVNDVLLGTVGAYQHTAIEESHVFSPSFVNNVRFGFNRVNDIAGTGLSASNPLASDASLGVIPGFDSPGFGATGTGLTTLPPGTNDQSLRKFVWNSFQGYDDAFFTKGKQTFKFGGGVERDQANILIYFTAGGSYSFSSVANLLTNTPTNFSATLPGTVSPRYYRQTIYAGYLQDDIRWKPNLTINLGIRYETSTNATEKNNKLASLPTTTATVFHLGTPIFLNPTRRDFAPRVGLAWDPFGSGKTSVRAGFGIFDVLPLLYQYYYTENNAAPFQQTGSVTASNGLLPGAYPNNTLALLKAAALFRVGYFQNNPRRDYVQQWNLSVQREIVHGLTVMVAYLGAHEPHGLFRADDSNMVQPTLTPAGFLWPCGPDGKGHACAVGFLPSGTQAVPAPTTVLNPSFGREDVTTWNGGYIYHGLQAQVIQHMSHGFQIQGSYTWGKVIDSGSGAVLSDSFANAVSNLLLFAPRFDRGLADYNIKENLTINGSWTVPKPKFSNRAADTALGGWELDAIFSARTGFPFTPFIGGDTLGEHSSSTYDFPNRLTGPGCDTAVTGKPSGYINLSCFGLPMSTPAIAAQCGPFLGAGVPAGTCQNLQGNAGRNSLIGPGMENMDFSLIKNTYFGHGERFNAQFRTEFFNIFNRANFNSPTDNETIFGQTGLPTAGAGLIDGTSTTSRQIQFALKLIW